MAKKFNVRTGGRRQEPQIQVNEGLFISQTNHDKLVAYIKKRLEFGDVGRETRTDRFERIDRIVAGYMILDDDDRKRHIDNLKGMSPKTTDFRMELVWAQLDDFLTYLSSVLIPDEGLYSTVSPAGEQDISNAFTAVLDKHAVWFKHFPELTKGLFDMLKYNFGGWAPIEWKRVMGNRLSRTPSGSMEIKRQVIREGNAIAGIDPYNFIYDISTDPTKLNAMGEFFSIIELHTPFRIKKMTQDGEIYSTDRFLQDDGMVMRLTSDDGTKYYKEKPDIEYASGHENGGTSSNWFSILGTEGPSLEVGGKFEMLILYIRIIPKDFGLNASDKYEIWRISIVSSLYIVEAQRMNNAHGMLPCAIGMPRFDGFKTDTKTFAETLNPLNDFASNEMNVRQKAARKALYGVTLYNKRQAPLMEKADVLGGKIPWSPTVQGEDINKAFLQLNDVPPTNDTMQNVQATIDLMEKLIPIDILRQVANLERATAFQAAATVQGANRRPFKYAQIINTQAMTDLKLIQGFNVMQFQGVIEVYDQQQGGFVEIDPSTFLDTDVESLVAAGLKGIDKLIYMELIRDIINMMLQSKVAQEQVDVVAIIDYWSNLAGDQVNFDQFKFKSQIDALPVQQRDIAFQLLQQFMVQQQANAAGGAENLGEAEAGGQQLLQPPTGTVDPGAGLT